MANEVLTKTFHIASLTDWPQHTSVLSRTSLVCKFTGLEELSNKIILSYSANAVFSGTPISYLITASKVKPLEKTAEITLITFNSIIFGQTSIIDITLDVSYQNKVIPEALSQRTDYNSFEKAANVMNDAFDNFEPYSCGDPAIPADTYLPFNTTRNYQKYIKNGFSTLVTADNYKAIPLHNNYKNKIVGYQLGTVPKAGEDHLLASGQWDAYIYWDSSRGIIIKPLSGAAEQVISLETLRAKGGASFGVEKIGIVLVGPGGNGGSLGSWEEGGGCSGYGKTTVYAPGGGGGGGGTVWGVIDLTKSNALEPYSIKIGLNRDRACEKAINADPPNFAGANYAILNTPAYSSLWDYWIEDKTKSIKITNTELYKVYIDVDNMFKSKLLATAFVGGNGDNGKKESNTFGGTGGGGAIYVNSYFYSKNEWIERGGNGFGYSYGSQVVYPAPGTDFYVNFLADETDNKALSTRAGAAPTIDGSIDIERAKGDENYRNSLITMGGNSFGSGSYGINGFAQAAGPGGGSATQYGKVRPEGNLAGSDGYWAIYY